MKVIRRSRKEKQQEEVRGTLRREGAKSYGARYIEVERSVDSVREYLNVLRTLVNSFDTKYFGGRITCDADKGLLRLQVRRIKKDYNVKMLQLSNGDVESIVTINRNLFERYVNHLGDRSNGVVHVFIRALCEHFAKSYLRTSVIEINTDVQKLNTHALDAHAAALLRHAWKASGMDQERGRIKSVTQARQKFSNKGWWIVYANLLRQITGRNATAYELSRVTDNVQKIDKAYIIDTHTYEVFRGDLPKRQTRAKRKIGDGTNTITVKIGDGPKLRSSISIEKKN